MTFVTLFCATICAFFSFIWCVWMTAVLSRLKKPLFFIYGLWGLRTAEVLFEAFGHHRAGSYAVWISIALLLIAVIWDDSWWRRLSKKLKDTALTAVNAASFKRQSAEAFS